MDRLLYTSLSALRAAMSRQATTANNLANANTVGFRAEMATSQPLWVRGHGLETRALSGEEVTKADMHAGAIVQTGRDLDVALGGDALLGVQADNGEEAYTRRGDLQLSETGLLTTGDGTPVMGDSGPITLPAADKIRIDRDGSIWILPQGSDPSAEMQQTDRLKLVSPTGSKIAKALDGLFRVEGGGTLPSDPTAKVTQGSVEGSNVNTAQTLVEMIEASRSWDTQLKLISSAKQIDTDASDLMRLPN